MSNLGWRFRVRCVISSKPLLFLFDSILVCLLKLFLSKSTVMLLCRKLSKIPRAHSQVEILSLRLHLCPAILRYASTDHARNEQIKRKKCSVVRVVNPEGGLSRKVPLSYVLDSIERKTHFIQLVEEEECIVKIMDSKSSYDWEKAHKKSAKKARDSKELQMTWAVEENDLMHKLKDARRYLQKGHLVDIAIARKKNAPFPPPNERQNRADQLIESLRDVAQEHKERTFKGGVLTIYLKSNNGNT